MYSIQKRILDSFAPFAYPSFGTLKPALKRLEEKECLTSRKMMSDGGKLSVYYEITKNGINELKRLILEDYSDNPSMFLSYARIKLTCADCLSKEERERLFFSTKSKALQFKNSAENALKDEYKQKGKELQKQVTEAMVAMKLALRMYGKKGGEGGDNGEER